MQLRFICDAGHGWGEVSIDLINELRIGNQISRYSYMKGDKAYLEEDCDLPIFLNKMEKQGKKINFIEEHSNADSWVRNLQRFEWGFE
jgi:hypothetical protein